MDKRYLYKLLHIFPHDVIDHVVTPYLQYDLVIWKLNNIQEELNLLFDIGDYIPINIYLSYITPHFNKNKNKNNNENRNDNDDDDITRITYDYTYDDETEDNI